MIPTRSASWSASSRYWVVRKTVVPSPLSAVTSSQIALRLTGSRPVVGSSRNSTARLVDQRRGEVEAPAHAARVGADPAVGGLGQPDPLEQRRRARRRPSAREQAVERRLQPDQLAPGHQRVERRLLQCDADRRAARRPASLDDVVAGDRARCRRSGAGAWSASAPSSSCRRRSGRGTRRSRPRRPRRSTPSTARISPENSRCEPCLPRSQARDAHPTGGAAGADLRCGTRSEDRNSRDRLPRGGPSVRGP